MYVFIQCLLLFVLMRFWWKSGFEYWQVKIKNIRYRSCKVDKRVWWGRNISLSSLSSDCIHSLGIPLRVVSKWEGRFNQSGWFVEITNPLNGLVLIAVLFEPPTDQRSTTYKVISKWLDTFNAVFIFYAIWFYRLTYFLKIRVALQQNQKSQKQKSVE